MNRTELVEDPAERTSSARDEARGRAEIFGEAHGGANPRTKKRMRIPASKLGASNGLKRSV